MERETEAQQFKRRKNKDPQTTRITSLNQELADLNQQKKVGLISTAEHKAIRQPPTHTVQLLFDIMACICNNTLKAMNTSLQRGHFWFYFTPPRREVC